MTLGFVVVVTYMLGQGVMIGARTCPDVICVADIENLAAESENVSRIQVYRANEYAHSEVSGMNFWPPLIDRQSF